MKAIANIVIVLIFIAFAVFLFAALPEGLPSDYECQITVDKCEKIPQAMTNAVNDVASRDFIVVDLDVKKYPLAKTYGVTCRGITRARLLKMAD